VATGKETGRIHEKAEAVAFSPDGRTLAYSSTGSMIHVWEVASGRERYRFSGHQFGARDPEGFGAGVATLTFTPGGRTLISGSGDTTLLLWDMLGVPGRAPRATSDLWADLADGAKAGPALGGLVAAPGETVHFLEGRLVPVTPCGPERLTQLLADLDNDDFAVRERATDELSKLGELADPALRKALAGNPSPEVRQRLKRILNDRVGGLSPEQLRDLRAVEALEHIDTPEARRLLETLAKGAPEVRLTREAAASLERLDKRGEKRPSP
jgi:hypothetical protein